MARQHLRMDERDNVTTLIDSNESASGLAGGGRADASVPFGHKVALCDITTGAPIIKYGMVIGHATRDILAGEHVHVHNCK